MELIFSSNSNIMPMAAGKIGPSMGDILDGDQDTPQDNPQDTPQDNPQVGIQDSILAFCCVPRSKVEILAYCGYKDIKSFTDKYLKPLLESN
jgi:hypothetical protein